MAMRNITKPYKGNYLKHVLIVTGVAIPVLLIFIIFFVIPFGTDYKHIKRESKLKERELSIVEDNYNRSIHDLKQIEKLNHEVLTELREPKDLNDFKAENPYIDSITEIKDLFEESEIFKKYVYRVETKYLYNTLENFNDLLSNGEQYGFRFSIDFPVKFEREENRLKVSFNINLYELKKIERDLIRPFTDIQK
jgi:hypothetical protein